MRIFALEFKFQKTGSGVLGTGNEMKFQRTFNTASAAGLNIYQCCEIEKNQDTPTLPTTFRKKFKDTPTLPVSQVAYQVYYPSYQGILPKVCYSMLPQVHYPRYTTQGILP